MPTTRREFLAAAALAGGAAAAWGIDDRDCRKVVQEIGGKPGALRVLSKVLRLAASYAQALNREICCEDVRASWRELGGME